MRFITKGEVFIINNIVDEACRTANRQVITLEQSGIEGLKSFGHATSRRAILPLEEHYHLNRLEIVFLIKGTQVYRVDSKEYSICGLSGFISYPNEVHGTGQYPQNVSEIYWLQLDLSGNILGLSAEQSCRLSNRLRNTTCRTFQYDNDMARMLADAFNCVAAEQECTKRIGAALLTAILNRLTLLSCSDKEYLCRHSTISSQITAAAAYIDENIEELLSLEDIAAVTGLSLSRFKSKFKEEIGVTPREFINKQKIERSKLLLAKGMSVIDTAMALSFSSSSYFSVTFKKFTTITPSDYCKITASSAKA